MHLNRFCHCHLFFWIEKTVSIDFYFFLFYNSFFEQNCNSQRRCEIMDIVRSYSARCFFWIFFFMILLCLLLDGALYIALDYLALKLPEVS